LFAKGDENVDYILGFTRNLQKNEITSVLGSSGVNVFDDVARVLRRKNYQHGSCVEWVD
jgi:hypothetical protein